MKQNRSNAVNMIHTLAQTLEAHMPDETVLIVPSSREGRRLLRQCAEQGHMLIGVRTVTPYALALEICHSLKEEERITEVLDTADRRELIFKVLKGMPAEGFFAGPYAGSRKTAELMEACLTELDMNEIGTISGNERMDAVQAVRGAYRKEKGSAADRIDVFRRAIQAAPAFYEKRDTHFAVLGSSIFSGLERRLISSCAGSRLEYIPAEVSMPTVLPNPLRKDSHREAEPDTDRMRFVRCRGTETEQHFILRNIINRGLPVEDCAVVCLNGDYAAGLYAAAELYHVPVSVAGGIPMSGSRLYYALKELNSWAVREYDAERLRLMVLNGTAAVERSGAFVSRLREKNIGWGRARYESAFLQIADAEKDPPEPETLKAWSAFLQLLFRISDKRGSVEEQKADLSEFLSAHAPVQDKKDAFVQAKAKKLLSGISWLDEGETVLGRLLELMEESSCLAEEEKEGSLWAGSLAEASCIGRKYLYVCGMSRFCMQGMTESPLLLDEERTAIGLLPLQERETENLYRFKLLLCRQNGEITLSYCDYDTERMIPLSPAPVFRELLGDRQAQEISYIPDQTRMLGDVISSGARIRAEWPEPAAPDEQTEAAELKESLPYSEKLASMSFSPSSLETALACPLKFYLQKVIGLYETDLPERSSDAWLTAAEMGTLCHNVLERYYREEGMAGQLLDEEIGRLKESRPLARGAVMAAERRKAQEMIERAIAWTEENNVKVLKTEQKFGRNAGDEPLLLNIEGREIGLNGSIDRVDRLKDGTAAVLDYKTGGMKSYQEHPERKLQPYLYALAMEQLDPSLSVGSSGYLFLRDGSEYLPVSQKAEDRQEKAKTVISLLDWLSRENMALAPCPAFVIGPQGIEGPGTEEDRLKEYKACSRYCRYAEFCPAAWNREPALKNDRGGESNG